MIDVWSELDDYPIHQDAKTLRVAARPDKDFDDATYFFVTDRAGEVAAFITLEIFPNRNLKRSAVFVRIGEKHVRSIWYEKLVEAPGREIVVGENRFTIAEPQKRWEITLRDENVGLEADLVWRPRCPNYRFRHVHLEPEGELAIDMQHVTTSSAYEGSLRVGDRRFDGLIGHRCRSWGVRSWTLLPFYTWLNAQFDDRCVNLWLMEDQRGAPLYMDGAVTTTDGRVLPIARFEHDIFELHEPHKKRAKRRVFRVELQNGEKFTMEAEEIGSIIFAPLPDEWVESDEETMGLAQDVALWYQQHTRFSIGEARGIGFVENLVAPGSEWRGIPPTEAMDIDPGEFGDDD